MIDVYILTGFLGAGKTTLLNNLLLKFKDQRNVVLENEFGKVSIDSKLVAKKYDEDIFELNNGCICCNLDEQLYDVLNDIITSDKGIQNLFIETTGVADAGNVISIFHREDIRQKFNLINTVCIVDCTNYEERLDDVGEIYRQIVAADILVLNKINNISEARLVKMEKQLHSFNPFAFITRSPNGDLPLEILQQKIPKGSFELDQERMIPVKGHRINSVMVSTTKSFDLQLLLYTLSVTLYFHYEQVFRIKGIVAVADSDNKFLIQSTGNVLTHEVWGQWQEGEERLSQLVFIGRELKTPVMEKLLQSTTK